jgi:hypothetical protein
MNFTFGTDPEFILIDKKGNPKSAIDVIRYGKKNRLEKEGNFFFYDNVLAECTVKPAHSKEEAIENISKSLKILAELIGENYKISTICSANFPEIEMNHPAAKEAGCDEEYCAYKMQVVSSKKNKKIFKQSNFRTAGGHIHLGTELGKSYETCIMLIRMLDLFLGVASFFMDGKKSSCKRRKLYGQAGRYRQPTYGIEYRTLSNFWLSSPFLVELVYDICSLVIKLTNERVYKEFWTIDYEKLNSDEFWNLGGDPSLCHNCHGYDVKQLRSMFKHERNHSLSCGKNIVKLAFSYMPKQMKSNIINSNSVRRSLMFRSNSF